MAESSHLATREHCVACQNRPVPARSVWLSVGLSPRLLTMPNGGTVWGRGKLVVTNGPSGEGSMPSITAEILVGVIVQLGADSNLPVTGADVIAWCGVNGVDVQGPGRNNQAFWDADNAEAVGRHRLLKFKNGEHQSAPVGWQLVLRAAVIRPSAAAAN